MLSASALISQEIYHFVLIHIIPVLIGLRHGKTAVSAQRAGQGAAIGILDDGFILAIGFALLKLSQQGHCLISAGYGDENVVMPCTGNNIAADAGCAKYARECSGKADSLQI